MRVGLGKARAASGGAGADAYGGTAHEEVRQRTGARVASRARTVRFNVSDWQRLTGFFSKFLNRSAQSSK
jgi:hypothetical protein